MSIPKEPRQMMINMMYLVLTALLAMNVSAEILNVFHVVNKGMASSNEATDRKNNTTMADFKTQLGIDQTKTGPWYNKAAKAEALVTTFSQQVDRYMALMVDKSGGWKDSLDVVHKDGKWKPGLGTLEDDRNLEVGTLYMVEQHRADSLKKSITDTRTQLLALIDDPNEKRFMAQNMPLQTPIDKAKNPDGDVKTWEESNFHMVPTIACLTILNKFKNDAKNSQAQLLDYFYNSIYSRTSKVDKFVAKVIAPSSYIMQGQDYKADIFVAAYSSSIKPTVYIGALNGNAKKDPADPNGNTYLPTSTPPVALSGALQVGDDGMGKFTQKGEGEGEKTYMGAVMVPDPDGKPVYYPFEAKYTTAKGSAVVSSDNLNIIYAGIPNPFSVSVPGFDATKVSATATGGTFSPSGAKGHYSASMPATMIGQKVKINISVKMDDNAKGMTTLASQEFVVKRIPDPVAKVAGKVEGRIKTGELKASPGPIATLQDFYFQGVTFTITSYDFVYIAKRADPYIKSNVGLAWAPEIKSKVDGAKPGDQIIIRNIKAKGPDGSTRSLPPISLEIN